MCLPVGECVSPPCTRIQGPVNKLIHYITVRPLPGGVLPPCVRSMFACTDSYPTPPPQKHWRWRVVGADRGVTRAFKSVLKCALCWESKNAHSDPRFSFVLLRRQPEQILKCHCLWMVLLPERFQKRGELRRGLLLIMLGCTVHQNRNPITDFQEGFWKMLQHGC